MFNVLVMDCHDWNLILMLDLRRFDRRIEPTKFQTPCFWCQFLVSGVENSDTSFWWPLTSFWYQKLGRRTWVVCQATFLVTTTINVLQLAEI